MSEDRVQFLLGDCRESLKTLPEASVHSCITSPPYFGLRNYGHEAQIGLEQTPEAYVAQLVEVFREVRRVLRSDGTVWLNLGDSYASTGGDLNKRKPGASNTGQQAVIDACANKGGNRTPPVGLKPKDLIGIPWRVALALQADGWYLRQDIIWHKPNPMPESVRDRCTRAHEYIFMLTKAARYYYDAGAIAEPANAANHRDSRGLRPTPPGQSPTTGFVNGRHYETRNKRSVWTVTPKPYKGAHFATFPADLVRPCLLAGTPPEGIVLDPFGGSGTVGMVAVQEGRRAILCELNPDYMRLAQARVVAGK